MDVNNDYSRTAVIATKNRKMIRAEEAFENSITNMPTSENAFNVAKDNLITPLRTARATKSAVFSRYINNKKLNRGDEDLNKANCESVQNLTLEDVIKYQQQYIKDKKWNYAVLGREADLDLKTLRQYGPITRLTLEQIFGY